MEAPRQWVVGVDPTNEAPVELAMRLASPEQPGLFVYVEPKPAEGFLADPFHDQVSRVEEYMSEKKGAALRPRFEALHPKWRFVEVKSTETAGRALCDYAKEQKAAMIIMGHSAGLVDRILGSNSSYAIRHAPCPVLVAKKKAEEGIKK